MRTLLIILFCTITATPAAAATDLVLQVGSYIATSRNGSLFLDGRVSNAGPDSTAARLVVELPPGVRLRQILNEIFQGYWRCPQTGGTIICTNARFEAGQSHSFIFELVSDQGSGIVNQIAFSHEGDTVDPKPENNRATARAIWRRPFRVTTSADSGDGSLRGALHDLNASCRGELLCEVVFDLPTPATIEPLTPLPAITACGWVIDGDQSSFTRRDQDRRITLSGAKLRAGHGLELRTSCTYAPSFTYDDISGLAIGGFPWNGIEVAPSIRASYSFSYLFLGTDATGTLPRPNDRGLVIDAPIANPRLENSILSGNRRSGLYVAREAFIEANDLLIGVGRDGRPLPNGASGIYIGEGGVGVNARSVIAYNAHFGVAIRAGASGAVYGSVHSNGVQAIDRGLDGPSPNRDDGRYPATPVVTDASFDAAKNETVIRVLAPLREWNYATLAVYANRARNASGRAEMERLLAQRSISRPSVPIAPTDYEFRVAGDLRGQIITAVVHYDPWGDAPPASEYSSEVSEGVAVR
jgi:hypothetical protein